MGWNLSYDTTQYYYFPATPQQLIRLKNIGNFGIVTYRSWVNAEHE